MFRLEFVVISIVIFFIVLILVHEGCLESLVKCIVDIEVLPGFRRGWHGALAALCFAGLSQCWNFDRIFGIILQVPLCQDQEDRFLALNFHDFRLPLANVFKWLWNVACDANHEAVSVLILHFSVDSKMLVAGSIVNFNLYLLAIDVLGAAEDVEDSRLVIITELVLQEVRDEAWLAYRGVADKHQLELLWSVRVMYRFTLLLYYLLLWHIFDRLWLLILWFLWLLQLIRLLVRDLILFITTVRFFVSSQRLYLLFWIQAFCCLIVFKLLLRAAVTHIRKLQIDY